MDSLHLKHETLNGLLTHPVNIRLNVAPRRIEYVREHIKNDLQITKALLDGVITFCFDESEYDCLRIEEDRPYVTPGSCKIGPVEFELDAELNITKFELDKDEGCQNKPFMRGIWSLLMNTYPSELDSAIKQYLQKGDKCTIEGLNRVGLDLFEQEYLREDTSIKLVPWRVEFEPIRLSHIVDILHTRSKGKHKFFKLEDIKKMFKEIDERMQEMYRERLGYGELQRVEPYKEVERYVVSTKRGPWKLNATVSRMSNGSDELGRVSIRLSYAAKKFTYLTAVEEVEYLGFVMTTSSIGPILFSTKLFNDLAKNKEQIVLNCVNEKLVQKSYKKKLFMYTGPNVFIKAVDEPCASLQEFLDRLTEPKETTAEVIAQWILESC